MGINGFININKPKDMTSNRALQILKRKLSEQNIKEKIGHMGTLDPLATGVLPVALGRATRLFNYSLDKEKEYVAEFIFGAKSVSLDTDSEVIIDNSINITKDQIVSILPTQIGKIKQIPPIFSAKNINGQRAYDLARKGKEFELPPKEIEIKSIDLLEETGENTFAFRIVCSGGTYIRSIARDIAKALGTDGVMSKLTRTRSGIFNLENSIDIDNCDDILSNLIPMENLMTNYPKMEINESIYDDLMNGKKISLNIDSETCIFLNGKFVGVCDNILGITKVKTWLV